MSDGSSADVIVVGLGAFGSAALYQIAKRGVRVLGIDRYTPPHAMGSSHGETRITRLSVGEGDEYTPLVLRSHEIWRELEAAAGVRLMEQVGGLILGSPESGALHHGRTNFVARSIAIAERAGIAHAVLDAKQVMSAYPQIAVRDDEVGYFEPSAGFLHPERCIATNLALATAHGARIRTDETVRAINQRGGAVEVITDRGRHHASRVVVSAGPWLPEMVPPAVAGTMKVFRQALHWFAPSDPAAYAPDRFPVFIWIHGNADQDYFYGFPALGPDGVKVATERYLAPTSPEGVARDVTPEESAAMFSDHVAGRLRGVTATARRTACCLYTVTPDSGFIIDALPERDRVLLVSACSGHGFKHSAAVGELLAREIAGEGDGSALAPFRMSRLAAAA